MTKTTTNLVLMLITIVAGTYFYLICCSECGTAEKTNPTTDLDLALELGTTLKSPFNESDDLLFNTIDVRAAYEIGYSVKENNTIHYP